MSEADQAGEARQGPGGRLLAGRYRLGGVLGRGGMGTVWRAKDEILGRTVAVKELRFPSSDEDEKRRLVARTLREAKAIARIRNNSAVTVFDVVDEDDRPWIVMELVEGKSLAEVIRDDGVLTPKRAAEVALAVLDVLRAAHREGILHRDVKPSNVLIAEDGRVVLTDFGIAQVEGDPSITSTGMLVGAPSYISPERARGHRPGPAADLWSLGALLYACVEGTPPYDKGSAIATLTAVMTEPVERPKNAGPLESVIFGLLAKDVEKRLTDDSARAMLQEVVHAPEVAPPAPAPDKATTSLRAPDAERRRPATGQGSGGPSAKAPAAETSPGAAGSGCEVAGSGSGVAGSGSEAVSASGAGKAPGAAQESRLLGALRSVRKAAAAATGAAATAVQGKSAAAASGASGTAAGSRAARSGGTRGPGTRAGSPAKDSGSAGSAAPAAVDATPAGTTPASPGAPAADRASDTARGAGPDASTGTATPQSTPGDPLRKRRRAGATEDPGEPRTKGTDASGAAGPRTAPSGSAPSGSDSGSGPSGSGSGSGPSGSGSGSAASDDDRSATGPSGAVPSGSGASRTGKDAATAVSGAVSAGSTTAVSGSGRDSGTDAATAPSEPGPGGTTRASVGAFGPAKPPATPPSRPRGGANGIRSVLANQPHRTLLIVAIVIALAVLGTILALTLPGDDTAHGDKGKGSTPAATGGGDASGGGKHDAGGSGGQGDEKNPAKDDQDSHKDSGDDTAPADKPSSDPTGGADTGADTRADTGAGADVTTYKDPQGFSIGLPEGWKRASTDATGVHFTGPDDQALLLAWTSSPKSDPVLDWHQQEHYMGLADYHRVRIDGLKYRGWPAADWEFTFDTRQGVKMHRIDRGFVVNPHRGYGMMYTAKDSAWKSDLSRATWATFTSTFQPEK